MADVSTVHEGIEAERAGADIVATTLSTYTNYTMGRKKPDLELVQKLAKVIKVPIVCEGGISSPKEAKEALELGAYAVTVGAMIVNVKRIVTAYVDTMK
jgi:N-acylglucosamine-6-phosphate 2-epimerase